MGFPILKEQSVKKYDRIVQERGYLMRKIAKIYIEYENMAVDQLYSYFCDGYSLERGMRVEVNFANKNIVGFVWEVTEMSEEEISSYPYTLKPILSQIDQKPFLNEELFALAKEMSHTCIAPFISCLSAMLPAKLKPKSSFKKPKLETWIVFDEFKNLKTQKQQEALSYLMENKEIKRSVFSKLYKTQIASLLKEGCAHLEERESFSILYHRSEDERFVLNHDQQAAIDKMSKNNDFQIYLLHGVTGSGKSEVFLQMAEKVIQSGKQVLFMVPEIGLTPQMVKRVSARFKEKVAIYHSSLNNQEKYEQYKLVAEKKVNIVVGTRSSVFMPFDNLGLIIMDEEHDQSYKQDKTPKYHTKDMAIFRAKYHNCPLILASATPSLESYARAIKNVYTLVEMPNRINGKMPETKLIDMKEAMQSGESYILSDTLKNAVQQRLDKNEQCVLLLNRRGYAPVLRCMDCGDVIKCPHCDMALNYHKQTNEMKCHTCGYHEPRKYTCKSCGSKNIKYIGMGTQKLQEAVQEMFPAAHIVRMDFDTTNKKNAHENLLKEFEEKGDILLGTQMIAKGLDFERVSLVGILNGDAMLNRSDYRSVELTFDLLVQASGRSGRKNVEGEVYMQVYDVNHYAVQCAQKHDYKTFFKHEMKFRHLADYPPYTYLGSITFMHKEEEVAMREAKEICHLLQSDDIKILGPLELVRIMDHNRVRIVLKGKNEKRIAYLLYNANKEHIQRKYKSKIEIEMNPYMLD